MKTGDIDLPAALRRLRTPGAPDADGFVSVFADDLEALLEAYDQAKRGVGLVAVGQRWRVDHPESVFHGEVFVVVSRHHRCWEMRRDDGRVIYMHDSYMGRWLFVPDPELPALEVEPAPEPVLVSGHPF